LQGILTTVFATKSTAEWLTLGLEHNVPIAPVNTPSSVTQDAQFGARFSWQPQEIFGAELLPLPLRIDGQPLVGTTPAPTVGQHTVEVLSEIGGYDAAQIAALKTAGVLG
jgi:crotonobetainyl-CoA:carnitine CoA-transferase CaiB-like acyl-CoA transferase